VSTIPEVPWPSEFELEVRREFADIRAHLSRQDALLGELQLENRRNTRAIIAELKNFARVLQANGAEHDNGNGASDG
jgi:hypothetical protein